MNVGAYTFAGFKDKAAEFHGYAAPGLLIGGYMVEKAKAALPEGTLFEAVVETKKCLPDAVQLLTLCSAGNNWMKVLNLGKYALSLFDKYTGEGYRVHLDLAKMQNHPEIYAWFMKLKAKKDQDTDLLLREIEDAGDSICAITPIRIRQRLLGHAHMGKISACPHCSEAFPATDGVICRGCQGEAPYTLLSHVADVAPRPRTMVVPVEEAVGKTALHDMTEIIPGKSKGAAFSAGQTITAGDVCRLQHMGRFSVAVADDEGSSGSNGTLADCVHENHGAAAFAERMAGKNIAFDLPPKEGKINFRATSPGLFTVDRRRLTAFNMVPDVMCATRQDGLLVDAGSEVAGTRVIPLYIGKSVFAEALGMLEAPLFSVTPLRRAKVGILVTGTEIFKGLIQDKFIPIITGKVENLHCSVVKAVIAPDDKDHLSAAIREIRAAGADMLITTGGLSVDPDDITRAALMEAGLTDFLYGAPVLPGTMSLVGYLPPDKDTGKNSGNTMDPGAPFPPPGGMQVIGVPACALYFKTTLFDALLPRLLAGRRLTRADMAAFAEGGFCTSCKVCTWPKCFFLK